MRSIRLDWKSLEIDKHASLFSFYVGDEDKSKMTFTLDLNVIKLFLHHWQSNQIGYIVCP